MFMDIDKLLRAFVDEFTGCDKSDPYTVVMNVLQTR